MWLLRISIPLSRTTFKPLVGTSPGDTGRSPSEHPSFEVGKPKELSSGGNMKHVAHILATWCYIVYGFLSCLPDEGNYSWFSYQ